MTTMQVRRSPSAQPSTPDCQVVRDPRPGEVLTVPPGTRLEVRFRRSLLSTWRVDARPGHLVPLVEGDHGFVFLVFDGRERCEQPLRMVRRRDDRPGRPEVRDVTVLVG